MFASLSSMEIIRLVTVHPMLVHFTLGGLPLIIIAYAVAARRKSARWTFVGDVLLIFTAAVTLLTGMFGLIANAVLEWPGGLGTWRWLHLGFGITSTVLLVGFAIARMVARRRGDDAAGTPSVIMAVATAAIVGFTGWIGGEVLVFHSGMAVEAAAGGALAPPVVGQRGTPDDIHEAMGQIRAHWASATAHRARMIVHEPSDEGFAAVAEHARSLQVLAGWLAARGGEKMHEHGDASEHGQAGGSGDHIERMARLLEDRAAELESAAQGESLAGLIESMAQVESTCARCHQELRWNRAHGQESGSATSRRDSRLAR